MMAVLCFILLFCLQLFTGAGLLQLCRSRLKGAQFLSLSIVSGMGLQAMVPFVLQLLFIPLTASTVAIGLLVVSVLFNLPLSKRMAYLYGELKSFRPRVKLYEWPFLLAVAFLFLLGAWRCFYLPPTPRDLTSGAEVIAEYAVREKSLVNSVFTVDLHTTNNQFKPPFIASLQLIYKQAGFPFGQVWLSVMVLAWTAFLYSSLRHRLHGLLAGMLMVAFMAIPELYGYSIMALYDYPNAVYFFFSVAMLIRYFQKEEEGAFALSALLMALATYARSETLVLAFFLSMAASVNLVRNKTAVKGHFIHALVFLLPSLLVYFISVTIYIKNYLPVRYSVENLVNPHLFDPSVFFNRFAAMNSRLVFSYSGINYFGYFIFLFLGIALVDALSKREWNREGLNYLYAVAVIYFGLPVLGHLLPLMDIEHSTKRGLFKIFPLMLLYMANSKVLRDLSGYIGGWEKGEDFMKS